MIKTLALYLSAVCLLLAGCAGNMPAPQPEPQPQYSTIEEIIETSIDYNEIIKNRLLAHYAQWKGTPYKYNSISEHGIDCSGFMYITFKSQFGIDMPRSTSQQVKLGEPVARSELQIGDLVFFKTGRSGQHVGVYIGNSQFMHASTREGVIISSLDNGYWQKNYWTSKRILG